MIIEITKYQLAIKIINHYIDYEAIAFLSKKVKIISIDYQRKPIEAELAQLITACYPIIPSFVNLTIDYAPVAINNLITEITNRLDAKNKGNSLDKEIKTESITLFPGNSHIVAEQNYNASRDQHNNHIDTINSINSINLIGGQINNKWLMNKEVVNQLNTDTENHTPDVRVKIGSETVYAIKPSFVSTKQDHIVFGDQQYHIVDNVTKTLNEQWVTTKKKLRQGISMFLPSNDVQMVITVDNDYICYTHTYVTVMTNSIDGYVVSIAITGLLNPGSEIRFMTKYKNRYMLSEPIYIDDMY